jgi:thioredoxin 1
MSRRTRRQTRQSEPLAGTAAVAVPSPIVVIDDANFFEQTAGGVTVVDFWAPWCRPCHAFAPIFDAAASDYVGRVSFGRCNVDANPKSAGLLQILSIPTLVVFGKDGSELRRVAGVLPRRQLDAIIEQVAPTASA